ncbi:hypothetical protein [uncultured Muribaculum sp.]|uniref:hypothetical protein n=1 Tax=uncultured Muribaculum sp. TaxID=1918613 RepID=UPI000F46256C|nr:hypothetical protein [uncultured Muribaculum sp.]ROT16022.1 hypothetical protein EEL48_02895 [Muribaculaceae bacterium Isolate-102 (HZI)]
MDICDRINEIIKHENLNIASFARKIGIGDQTVRGVVAMRRNKPGFDFIMKIVQTFDWLNAHWLITGEGDMICENLLTMEGGGKESPSIEALLTLIREKDKRIEQLIRENATLAAPCSPPSAAEPADTSA